MEGPIAGHFDRQQCSCRAPVFQHFAFSSATALEQHPTWRPSYVRCAVLPFFGQPYIPDTIIPAPVIWRDTGLMDLDEISAAL
jgi:hypothetical protein